MPISLCQHITRAPRGVPVPSTDGALTIRRAYPYLRLRRSSDDAAGFAGDAVVSAAEDDGGADENPGIERLAVEEGANDCDQGKAHEVDRDDHRGVGEPEGAGHAVVGEEAAAGQADDPGCIGERGGGPG